MSHSDTSTHGNDPDHQTGNTRRRDPNGPPFDPPGPPDNRPPVDDRPRPHKPRPHSGWPR